MNAQISLGSGWCCEPCLFRIEYGNVPADWSADEVADWLAHIENNMRNAGADAVTLGHGHLTDDECAHMGEPCADGADCDCETRTFSRSQCEHCGDRDAGTRHAFTWWASIVEPASV
jgi:hypothetical protein